MDVRIQFIPVEKVRKPVESVRRFYREDHLKELENSLKGGVLQPIIVRSAPQGYFDLITGSRRLRAAKNGGIKKSQQRSSIELATEGLFLWH